MTYVLYYVIYCYFSDSNSTAPFPDINILLWTHYDIWGQSFFINDRWRPKTCCAELDVWICTLGYYYIVNRFHVLYTYNYCVLLCYPSPLIPYPCYIFFCIVHGLNTNFLTLNSTSGVHQAILENLQNSKMTGTESACNSVTCRMPGI